MGGIWRRGQEARTGLEGWAQQEATLVPSLPETQASRGPYLAYQPGQGGSGHSHPKLSPFSGYQ